MLYEVITVGGGQAAQQVGGSYLADHLPSLEHRQVGGTLALHQPERFPTGGLGRHRVEYAALVETADAVGAPVRITSYNVCYTKLLRHFLRRQFLLHQLSANHQSDKVDKRLLQCLHQQLSWCGPNHFLKFELQQEESWNDCKG